jgi:hypothetical protein
MMTGKARPFFAAGIDELIEAAEDESQIEDVRNELAFRKSRKAVKLAKEIGGMTKRRPSSEELRAQWDTVEPMDDVIDIFSDDGLEDKTVPF